MSLPHGLGCRPWIYCFRADCQVLRRPSYKGGMGSDPSLPVDATSVLGTLLILACILPTSTLSANAVNDCLHILQVLEQAFPRDVTLGLLPHSDVFLLNVQAHRVRLEDVKMMIKELGLQWGRQGSSEISLIVSLVLALRPLSVAGVLNASLRDMSLITEARKEVVAACGQNGTFQQPLDGPHATAK